MHLNKEYINKQEENDTINIREELEKYLIHWKWFVLGVFLSISLAFLYLRYTTPLFKATASILIKDNQKSGISAELAAFEDLGIVGGSANNTDNEIEILKSRKIIGRVVDSLNLNLVFLTEGRVKTTESYEGAKIELRFIKKTPTNIDTSFIVKLINDNNFQIKTTQGKIISENKFGNEIDSKIGSFILDLKKGLNKNNDNQYTIKISSREKVITKFRNFIKVSPVNKKSSVLNLSLTYPIRKKAEDILDELVKQYNLDAIADKNEVSKKTSDFIQERLQKVSKDLANLDDDAKNYKTSKGFTGVSKEAELILESVKQNDLKLIELRTQKKVINWTQEYLNKNSNNDQIIPSLGVEDPIIAKTIEEYNTLIQKRNTLSVNAGFKNPTLVEYEKQIVNLSNGLKQSLANTKKSLDLQIDQFKIQSNKINAQVASIPAKERGFIDIARQLEIVSGLYGYLLKKKEESDISLAVTVPNAKIIDKGYSSHLPVSPKKPMIILAALSLGMIVPFIIIYLKNLLDTKVHTKNDIESAISVPFLGDVPNSESKEKVVVGHDVRSSTAEAFRLLRTNLDFMLTSNKDKCKTIFITSTTSGEGKSFISINTASTLALSGKKVLLVGMDLRAPKVTEYLGLPDRRGITNYITDESINLDDLKFSITEVENLDIIASGVIPPNPAELLMTDRIEKMFSQLKSEYDYLIVDTAPVNLVTDTLLIAKYADLFMYVARANYLDKRLLSVPQALYDEKRLPNMAIVLNDTDPKRSYGYGYGGYGYGYGYVVVDEPWYKKIFNRK